MEKAILFGRVSQDRIYVRLVYFWLLVGILIASASAWVSLNVGGTEMTVLDPKEGAIATPVMVAMMAPHPYLTGILFLGLVLVATFFRKVRGLSALTYLLFTAFSGLFVGPFLFFAEWTAAHHTTLSAHPIRDSFFITAGMFMGLTTYAWSSKKDMSWMGGFLWAGLWVTIVASILAIFVQSQPFNLAVDSVVVLLFGGYILYDTQRILKRSDGDDPMGDAMNLFLDVFNIFIRLVAISSSED